MIKSLILTLLILFLVMILGHIPVKSQVQFILKNDKSVIGLPKYSPNSDTIIVRKLDGKRDTINKSDIVTENEVKVSFITNETNYINVDNLKIFDSTFKFTFRAKDIKLHRDSIIRFSEKVIQNDIDSRGMVGVGLGFPYGLGLNYDKKLNNDNGYRLNLNASVVTSFIFDYYINIHTSNDIEQNISFSGGLYVVGGSDFAHGHGPKLGFTLGSTYDLKINHLLIRAGLVFTPAMESYILPNVSVGLVF